MNDPKVSDKKDTVSVWDPAVRIAHWVLVAAFAVAYVVEDDFLGVHVWAGYAVGVVISLRIVWGLIGTRHARFSDFVRSPATIVRYLRDMALRRDRRYLGHNPAGGGMILALLLGLTGTVASGLMIYAIEDNAGPLAGWVAAEYPAPPLAVPGSGALADAPDHSTSDESSAEAREDFWEETHEIFANGTLLLVLFHILGVLHASYSHRENLVKAMFTGRKRPIDEPDRSFAESGQIPQRRDGP